jgi:ComEC/Rec2-related protein
VYSRIRVDSPFDATVLPQAHGFDPKSLALQAGAWMRKTLTLGLDPASDQARLIVAMTLGETSPFDDQLMEAFRETGTLHLFSVSGLHVGMLGMLLWLILSVLGIPNKPRALLIIALLFFYALVTGWKPASLRAATMGSFVLLGLVLNRPSAVLNSLLAAAFFLLISNPRELFNPGFQMSFLVVGSLILLCPPLVGWLRRPLDVDPFIPIRLHTPQESMRTWLAANLAPSGAVVLAAWCGSLALTFFYFHLISFSAIPANLVCVPLSFCVMGISVMALMSGLISSGLAVLFNNANWLFAGALLQSVQFLAGLPGAWVYAAAPELNPPMTRMTVFDFGAGAATAIESKGSVGLVDCGPAREFSKTLLPHLRSLGRSRLDWMILTHGDAGHLGAAREVLSACPPERLFESPLTDRSPTRRWLQSKIAERQLRRDFLNAGMEVPLTSAFHVECLYPPEELDYDTADDKALVLRASIGRWKVLFLSDAGPRSIEWLLAHASEHLKSDVVIKGAHRSGMAIPSVFWEKAQPAAVISTSHGFPRSELLPAETLRDLKRLGISLLRQDETGAVILTFRDESLHMRGYLNGAELTLGD